MSCFHQAVSIAHRQRLLLSSASASTSPSKIPCNDICVQALTLQRAFCFHGVSFLCLGGMVPRYYPELPFIARDQTIENDKSGFGKQCLTWGCSAIPLQLPWWQSSVRTAFLAVSSETNERARALRTRHRFLYQRENRSFRVPAGFIQTRRPG